MDRYEKNGKDSWPADRAKEWYAALPWCCGFNYLPAYAANSTGMWQKEDFDPDEIRKELGWAEDWGYSSLRVFLPFIVWRHDPGGFIDRLDAFLEIASGAGISTVPILFDDCAAFKEEYLSRWIIDGVGHDTDGMNDAERKAQWRQPVLGPQPEPVPGVHNSVWTPSPGSTVIDDPAEYAALRCYVKDVVSSFAEDGRVLFWDLYNEPGNGSRYSESVPLIKDAFAWCREVSPVQPLTVCVGFVYHECDNVAVELSDIISFHSYSPKDGMIDQIDAFSDIDYPLMLTEWMARTRGSTITGLLPWLKEQSISCWQWGLVDGKTQTKFPWGYSDKSRDPDPWFHDVIRPDGRPYDPKELQLVRTLSSESSG